MNLILLGAPGAGKGTQAAYIKEKYNILHISTGDILRTNVKNETVLGIEAKKFMDSGNLVPDELVIKLVADRLSNEDVKSGFMLDGFPRTVEQAKSLDEILVKNNLKLNAVLNIDVKSEELITRIAGRRLCKQCQASYHIKFNPPKVDNMCDSCGSQLFQRPDDTRETVENRIKVYEAQTKPLIDYYGSKNVRVDIDGAQSFEDVFSQIVSVLGA